MKTKLLLVTILLAFAGTLSLNAAVPERKGWWKFDDATDMLKADIGTPLTLTGSQTSVSGPLDGNLATQLTTGSYLTMTHGIAANGGGTLVNEYSLQMDISVPQLNVWNSFYQTAPANDDDAEMFINTTNFIGAWRYGYSATSVLQDTWYRIVVSVKNGNHFKIFVNGQIWVDGAGQDIDGRDALQTVLLMFADNDGEDNTINCAELGIWDVALTAAEALELGDATTAPTPPFPAKKGWWKFDDTANLVKAETGLPLVLTGTMESVEGPGGGNLAVEIGIGSNLAMDHGIAANGGGALVNEYSLMMDILMPQGGMYHAIFQTTPANNDDAELFINGDNLIGAWRFGYSTLTVSENVWYRLVVTVKNGEYYRIYLNGYNWVDGTGQDIDSRDALQSTLLLFADEDGEDNIMRCAEVAIWDKALTADEVATLGDPTTGIFEKPAASSYASLGQNFPNPFATETTFPYEMKKTGNVTFRLIDMAGKEITSVNEGKKVPGTYTYILDAGNLANGIYYLQMIVDGSQHTRKVVVLH